MYVFVNDFPGLLVIPEILMLIIVPEPAVNRKETTTITNYVPFNEEIAAFPILT